MADRSALDAARDEVLQALLRGFLPPDAHAEGELIIPTLPQATDGLCLCNEPHWWTAAPCPGPAPHGTPTDTVVAAALSRALYSHTDPNALLVEEDVQQDDGAVVTETANRQTFLLDPHDFDFFLATLARALTRYAANPTNRSC